jgi:hypothetical protein
MLLYVVKENKKPEPTKKIKLIYFRLKFYENIL